MSSTFERSSTSGSLVWYLVEDGRSRTIEDPESSEIKELRGALSKQEEYVKTIENLSKVSVWDPVLEAGTKLGKVQELFKIFVSEVLFLGIGGYYPKHTENLLGLRGKYLSEEALSSFVKPHNHPAYSYDPFNDRTHSVYRVSNSESEQSTVLATLEAPLETITKRTLRDKNMFVSLLTMKVSLIGFGISFTAGRSILVSSFSPPLLLLVATVQTIFAIAFLVGSLLVHCHYEI